MVAGISIVKFSGVRRRFEARLVALNSPQGGLQSPIGLVLRFGRNRRCIQWKPSWGTKVIGNYKVQGRKWYISKFRDESVEWIIIEGLKVIFSLFLNLSSFVFRSLLYLWALQTENSRILFSIGAGNKYLKKHLSFALLLIQKQKLLLSIV